MKIVRESAVPSGPADPEKFTGEVWQAEVLERMRDNGLRGLRFVYGPGARSHWHVHTEEQAIVVVGGKGLVQWEGRDDAVSVESGDWIHVQPGIAHWHGAAPDNVFIHLAITAGGTTQWRDAVTDVAYQASLPGS